MPGQSDAPPPAPRPPDRGPGSHSVPWRTCFLPGSRVPAGGTFSGSPRTRCRTLFYRVGRPRIDDAHLLDDHSAALVHLLAETQRCAIVTTVRIGESVPDSITVLWKDELDLPLTRREEEIATLAARGHSNREIAEHLVSPSARWTTHLPQRVRETRHTPPRRACSDTPGLVVGI